MTISEYELALLYSFVSIYDLKINLVDNENGVIVRLQNNHLNSLYLIIFNIHRHGIDSII